MRRIQATPTLLVLLLISSLITNVSVWQLSGSLKVLSLQEEEVPSQTSKFTVPVTDGTGTFEIDFEVTTTMGEFDDPAANPPKIETKSEWLTRHMDTVKSAKNEAEGYDLDA